MTSSAELLVPDAQGGGLPGLVRAALQSYDRVLLRGALAAFAINASGLVLGFFTQVLLARTIGSAQYGSYLYVMGWANVALICTLEFSGAAVRYVGVYAGAGDWQHLRGFLRRSHQLVVLTSLAVGVVGIAVALTLPSLAAEHRILVVWACALLPMMALLQLQSSCLQGLKRVMAAQAPTQLLRPVLLAGGVLLAAHVAGLRLGTAGALALQLGATSAAVLATAVLLRRARPAPLRDVQPSYRMQEWLRTSIGFVGIALSQLILSAQADVLIVGTMLGTHEAGLYGAASQFALLISFAVTAVMFIAQPLIADLHARNRTADLARLTTQIVRLSILGSAPVFLMVIVFGPWMLSWFGDQFTAAYPVLLILALSQLLIASIGMLAGYMLTMTGYQRDAGWVIAATAILNLALSAVLTRGFGVIGTALATVTATLLRSIALTMLVRMRLGLRLEALGAAG